MFEFLEKYLMGPLTKLSNYRLVRAITAAGMATITFSIVGSMFLVLNVLPTVITPLQSFYDATLIKVNDIYMLAYNATMAIIALYFLVVIPYEYTKIIADEEDMDLNPITGMLLSVFAYFMLVPQFSNTDGLHYLTDLDNNIISGWEIGAAPLRLGAIGIFTAIIISWFAVNLYKFCVEKNIIIKMPDAVPDGVANSFTALLPAFFLALIVMIINGLLIKSGTDIFKVIAVPFGFVTKIAGSWGGLIIIYFLMQALWLVGIHGATIITSLLTPVVLYNMQQNAEGAAFPFAGEFNNAVVTVGGSGSTLVFIFMLAFMSKSEQFKMLGKASFVPAIFNINEPIIFGLPIVYNPYFAIPFVLAPIASMSIAYWAFKLGMIHPIIAQQPWPTPVGIGGFIATGGDWKAIILSLICAAVAGLIYYPFFKKRDNELYREELAAANDVSVENVVVDEENYEVKIVDDKDQDKRIEED